MQKFRCIAYAMRKIKPSPPGRQFSHKVLTKQIAMRLHLVTLIVLFTCVQVSARVNAQTISIKLQNQPLEQAFKIIQQQTGYRFWYMKANLKDAKNVSASFKNASINEVLNYILKDQELDYEIVDKVVTIRVRTNSLAVNASIFPEQRPIDGQVFDENGKPLSGVTVNIKGTNVKTVTDREGNFKINASSSDVIVFQYVGFKMKEQPINGGTHFSIGLEAAISELDQVRVIAYGTTTKRLTTGNVASVKSDEIARQPVNNPILALAGRVPGLFVTQSSGISGSNINVRIQGVNSIANGNNPFYVIDGIPFNSETFSNPRFGFLTNILSGGSPLALISPSMIESIEVLKDADATAIYGSRAANGAILITTKKGKDGKTKIDLNVQNGWGKVTKKLELLNTEQYLEIRKEAYFVNDKLSTSSTQYATQFDINGTWDQNRYTDWQKELIGNTSRYQDYQFTVSGGNATTQFLAGGNFHRETSVFPGDLADRRISMQYNITHRSLNNKFKFQLSGSYLDNENNLGTTDLTARAIQLAPNAPNLYLSDGNLNWEPLSNGSSTWDNPLRFILRSYNFKADNLLANSIISYQILPELELSSSVGFNRINNSELIKQPFKYFRPEQRATATAQAQNSQRQTTNVIFEPQLNFRKFIGKGLFSGLLGMTIQNSKNDFLAITASGFTSDGQIDNFKAAPTLRIADAYMAEYRYNAVFGRFGYEYNKKYILNFTARRDGTSRFGSENRYHAFYSIAGAWIFSEEQFAKFDPNILSFGKLRASYGTTGSDQVGDYSYLNLFSNTSVLAPYQGSVGLIPSGIANPYLTWEQTNKLNVALDLGILKDHVFLTFNYFRNVSTRQLLNAGLPSLAGFETIYQNLPAKVLNRGIEVTAEVRIIRKKDLAFTSSFNLTVPKNKLIDFPGLASNNFYKNTLTVGESIQINRAYDYAGINTETGTYQFRKNDGTLVSSPSFTTDYNERVDLLPKYYGGLNNTISYKTLQLDFLVQFVKQKSYDYKFGNNPGTMMNQPTTVLDRWRSKEDIGSIQRVTTFTSDASYLAFTISDGAYTDASYFRLKNVSLSWALPLKVTNIIKLQSARLYLLGQNLITVTNFLGDPETRSFTTLPTLKMMTVGFQAVF
jgi:TonB-linked SusC/RagA family outer membrane protein